MKISLDARQMVGFHFKFQKGYEIYILEGIKNKNMPQILYNEIIKKMRFVDEKNLFSLYG